MHPLNLIALVLAGLSLACGPEARGRVTSCGPSAPETVDQDPPTLANPRSQLEWATRCKLALRGLQAEDLARARLRAVEAYRAVRIRHSGAHALAAEAAFRAGELLRSGGLPTEAAHEFRVARELGRGTRFRARAQLEQGHILRRSDRLEQALEQYEILSTDLDAERRERDLATFWSARIRRDQGFEADARRIWLRLATSAQDPLARIRAYDAVITSAARAGDFAQAWSHWQECRSRLAGTALEATELGERVREALQNLRCARVLRRSLGDRARFWPRVVHAHARTRVRGAAR